MSKQLPERPSLEYLKNEAKALKKAHGLSKLSEAQFAVAKEYGFPSWTRLKQYVEGYDDLREAFFDAIRAGDRDRVAQALHQSPGLIRAHDPRHFGEVPISTAANRSDKGMIDLLLKAGADIDARSDWWAGSFGALDYADEETSAYLLKKGAKLTAHSAARLGMAKELKEILSQNPEAVRERGGDGQFPLHFAKTAEIVDILVDAGADLDARDIDHESTAAQWRIKNGEVLKRLVERGAATDIFIAVALDDPDLIAQHLEQDPEGLTRKSNQPAPLLHDKAPGAPIYIYEIGHVSPIQLAANLEKQKAFDFLFEKSPPALKLLAATWRGDRETALKYKSEAKNLAKEEAAQICDAARYRRLDLLRLMLELGFDVDAQDHEGMSPVMWSGFHGWKEGIETVLPYQPNLEIKNVYGGTALGTLTYGSVNGWYRDAPFAECAQMLIDAGSEVLSQMSGSPEVNEVLAKSRNR